MFSGTKTGDTRIGTLCCAEVSNGCRIMLLLVVGEVDNFAFGATGACECACVSGMADNGLGNTS